MRLLQLITCLFLTATCVAQSNRLVLNDSVYVVMDKGVYIILDNPNPNAITLTGTQNAGIVSEDEDNQIWWNIGTATGNYKVPFCYSAPQRTPIPVEVNVTTAGVGAGRLFLSTYRTATAMNAPWPSMVFCMDFQDCSFQGFDHSLYAIDRYWIVYPNNYTVFPTTTLSLTAMNVEAGGANTINLSTVKAMRFDDGNGEWVGYSGGTSTVGTTTTKVDNIVVSSSDIFAAWTFVDASIMLPIELTKFSVQCHGKDRLFYWETATETNNDFFVLEKSWDGETFFEIDQQSGAGTSLQPNYYSALDTDADREAFYRLMQVDFDGTKTYSDVITGKTCSEEISEIHVFPNPSNGIFRVETGAHGECVYQVTDMMGKLVHQSTSTDGAAELDLSNEPAGVYLLEVEFSGMREVVRLVKL